MTGQQKLWQGVVMQALMDATQGIQKGAKTESARILHNTLNRERERADTWIRDCGSNFRFVCDLAGMDPYFISDAYRAGRIDGKRLRAKTGEGAV
ncbi:hypothetical protein [Roseovarius sp. SK2]|nr:hypothetical protein [Roseovarius sp. SK2]